MSNHYVDIPVTFGVTSLDGLTGALTLVAGTGISIVDGVSTITISATGIPGTSSIGTYDSQAPAANGLVISGTVLYAQSASATVPGMVSTGAQTLAGIKTLTSQLNANGGIDRSTVGTLTIGATNSNIINIGNSGATVNIQGTTIYENTPQLLVADPLITINVGGGAGSGQNSGIQIEEASVITGYAETSNDRNSWDLKAPNTAGVATITPGVAGIVLNQSSHNPVTIGVPANGLSVDGSQVVSLGLSSTSTTGALSDTDWNTFNSKQAAGNYITALTGEVTASGPGSVAATVSNAAVIAKVLTGYVVGSNTPIAATDSILQAFQKTQGQLNATVGAAITALTGDATATGPGSVALTLATVNSNVGSFGTASSVGTFTVNGKGLVTAASNTSIQIAESQVTNLVSDLAGKQPVGNYITALTGDVTASGPGSVAATLAAVNLNTGSFGSSTSIPSFTVNGKGLITAASSNVVIAPAGTLTGTTLAANVVSSSLTSVGTIATGVWNGTAVDVAHGGTGLATLTANNVILGNGTSTPLFVAPGSSGNLLTSNGTTWTSTAPATSGTVTSVAMTVPSFLSVAGSPITSSGTLAVTLSGTALPVANGGTGATTLTNHGVLLGQGTSAVVATTAGSAGQVLQSGGASADPTWSTPTYPSASGSTGTILRSDGTNNVYTTATYPATTVVNRILYSSATNVIGGITSGATSALVTDSSSVPAFTSGTTANRLLRTDGTTVSFAQAALTTDVTGTLPVANGGTGTATAFTAGSVVFAGASGTYSQNNTNLFWDDTQKFLGIGNGAPTNNLHITGVGTGNTSIMLTSDSHSYNLIVAGSGTVNTGKFLLFDPTSAATRIAIQPTGEVGIGIVSPTSTLHVNGNLSRPIRTVTSNATVAVTDTHIINNKSGSSLTLTLPTASSFVGREINVRTIQAQTVVSATSNVIPLAGGGAGTAILAGTANKWALLVSDGTNWLIHNAN